MFRYHRPYHVCVFCINWQGRQQPWRLCVLVWSRHVFTSHSSFWDPQCPHSSLFIAWKSCSCPIIVSTPHMSHQIYHISTFYKVHLWDPPTGAKLLCLARAARPWLTTSNSQGGLCIRNANMTRSLRICRSRSHWSFQSKKCEDQTCRDTRLSLWPTEAKNLCSEKPTDLISRLAKMHL